jgi:hypothetical protein
MRKHRFTVYLFYLYDTFCVFLPPILCSGTKYPKAAGALPLDPGTSGGGAPLVIVFFFTDRPFL